MKALRFRLSGKTGFFKQPDVNTYLYYTYGQIHRVALLGLLGAIVGYKGYNEKGREKYPEFYKKLKDLKISIVSEGNDGIFDKKLQIFNNSTAFASNEEGGNLIVKQVWLENPSWLIYILLDSDQSEMIKEYILNKKTIFTPYLGTNDHMANISNCKIVDLEKSDENIIDSLFWDEDFKLRLKSKMYKYEENLPFFLEEDTERYIRKKTLASNGEVRKKSDKNVIFKDLDNNLKLVFYSEEGIYET
ncbi:type I-B CRISPR-associated protein Cas5b [Anaerococcus vaginalis]|uniref:type I-B CRISPR-associated protein Cas5b n=1 Tax=Anaerococcus vaginalis TaxID=33037 RepID=UPI002432203B|nr:type I-B CRISPR-associated protein Cas5b [Anaerococcus vaginalis]MBS6920764.1 type I-B CRISPR-associated protein Cas5 [Anaerococcus vaginalis]MDU1707031.1 type I-B CRISPR-associated protein Cas5b [Anaerococcus vaginalis]MDU1762488.1 type I-B CRISPR-associated protein Cas5b [Anaerococcus vaginalis]MDU5988334.1 type I-B CRISPR-associated protein Cas5b [Anaerococcus vaginalis]MDU7650835.1 type I-B CRISPR-associated protein Cas5b [Anaerococcus vaginalis]